MLSLVLENADETEDHARAHDLAEFYTVENEPWREGEEFTQHQ
jgi:hypothetical protein